MLSVAGSGACDFKDRGISIDAYDCAIWPNEASGKQSDIACAAAEVQHLHAWGYAGVPK